PPGPRELRRPAGDPPRHAALRLRRPAQGPGDGGPLLGPRRAQRRLQGVAAHVPDADAGLPRRAPGAAGGPRRADAAHPRLPQVPVPRPRPADRPGPGRLAGARGARTVPGGPRASARAGRRVLRFRCNRLTPVAHSAHDGAMSDTFLLITGAWHGGRAWRPVAQHLRAAGHRVLTPTLPGLADGDDPTKHTL